MLQYIDEASLTKKAALPRAAVALLKSSLDLAQTDMRSDSRGAMTVDKNSAHFQLNIVASC